MNGRRLPIKNGKPTMPEEPGDYCGPIVGFTADKPAVLFLLPIARDEGIPAGARAIHTVTSPPHSFTEEDDGTLTIAGSIGAGPSPYYWHGYLEHGVWRQV